MSPVQTRESNFVYLGPSPEIADLPCRTEHADTFSVWELTEAERQVIAMGGRIRLGIHGVRPIPPVSLQVVDDAGPFERVLAPCRTCGLEVEAAEHGSGPGTHAYKSRGVGTLTTRN